MFDLPLILSVHSHRNSAATGRLPLNGDGLQSGCSPEAAEESGCTRNTGTATNWESLKSTHLQELSNWNPGGAAAKGRFFLKTARKVFLFLL